jgi:hypothetical protein
MKMDARSRSVCCIVRAHSRRRLSPPFHKAAVPQKRAYSQVPLADRLVDDFFY